MDFAKGLLMKYGWQEGQGIGKNEDGIVKPIKANLKFDNAGLSYDKASEFTNHWWERAFNSAADNLNINSSTENVSLSVKDSEAVELTANGFSVKNLKHKDYQGFFQKSNQKLERLAESSESETETDTSVNFKQIPAKSTILSDEAILKACGGRTAHKGARHGLSLSGKLSRIEAQEKQLLAANVLNTETATNIFQNWVQVKKKRKNRDQKTEKQSLNAEVSSDIIKCSTSSPDSDKLIGLIDENDYQIKCASKKKKRQQRHRDEDLAKSLSQLSANDAASTSRASNFDAVQNSSKAIKKEKRTKKKHRRRPCAMEAEAINETTDDELNRAKFRAKSKKSIRNGGQIGNSLFDASSSDCEGKEMPEDPLVQQIASVMKRYPTKKFKVIAEELTPFQKNHLRKSGLRIELKSKKRDKKKQIKERVQLEKISKKIEQSMVFSS